MGKRNAIVVSSSDDDDDKNLSLDSNLSHSKPKSRASSVPRASSRRSKKTRLSDSYAISSRESNGFDEIKLVCEDFDDGFSGFKISTGSARSNGKDLWVDKYKPRSLEELAVHKKKVEEVKLWFEEKLRKQKEEFCNNVLLITGQAGVGKSATVHVIASHLGATVCEWETPIPTIWQEHLHNSNSDHNAFLLKERFARLPLKMDAPEKVLCKSHGQARPVADFLHENVLDFLSEEAIDDAWVVTSYLSDADFLLASLSGMRSRNYEAENIVQSSAASVSVRGVLFGNFHPSPSRWHAIRRPRLWQVEQSLRHNKLDMVSQRCVAYDGLSLSDLSVVATEFKPVLKWLGFRESEGREAQLGSTKDNMLNDDTSLDDEVNETTDDEIEDWGVFETKSSKEGKERKYKI